MSFRRGLFKEEQFSSAHLGHLGLVADKIDSLKIIDLIDNRLPVSEVYGAKVSHGERSPWLTLAP